jgi:hypothetical protein
MNRYLLPKIDKKFWNTTAALFSFLSGFWGIGDLLYIS